MRYTRLFENLNESTEIVSEELLRNDKEQDGGSPPKLDPSTFLRLVCRHKALLLRSSASSSSSRERKPYTVDDVASLMASLNLTEYKYVGGAAPRRIIPVSPHIPGGESMIYTANEAPPDMLIPFHHELAQVQNPPQFIFFYCEQPSETGGETALIDSTLVYRFANDNFPEFMEKLKLYGARYTRTLPSEDDLTSPIGRSFYNTYQVTTREEVEAKLDAIEGCSYEWQPDGSLRVESEPIPAVRFIGDEGYGEPMWQWTFHNSVIAAFVGWEDCRNDRKKSIKFGNGEPMDETILEAIATYMEQSKVSYRWQKGDLFCLHNRLVMHSRNAFTGKRRIYASMFGGPRDPTARPLLHPPRAGILANQNKNSQQQVHTLHTPSTFGCWRLDTPEQTVYEAIVAGYRRIDSACDYGNEVEVGTGIRRAIDDGICTREELYVTTKLWNTYHASDKVPLALERSLQDLGLDYVDEYLIHFPISMEYVPFDLKYPPEWHNLDGKMVVVPNDINTTWKAMEDLVKAGKALRIGLSNFNCQHLRQVLSVARIPPSSLQIECHPHLSQDKLIRFARQVACGGLTVTVFSPMGATSYLSLDMAQPDDQLLIHPTVQTLATKHSKTPAQILLRWALQRGTIPISKSSSPQRMTENQALYDFYLYREDMDALSQLNKNRRYNDPGVFCEKAFGTFCPIYE